MNQQRFICAWLDNETNRSKDCLYAQDELRTVVDSFRIFNNLDQCIEFMIDSENLKIIFITFDEQILPMIHSWDQIYSIFILNSNISNKKYLINEYEKIEGIFEDIKIICQKIKGNILPSKPNPSGISFLSSSDIDSKDVNRQDPTFMYSQLLKEIILNDHLTESDEETKYEMIDYCRKIYADDQTTLTILNEFEKDFLPELAIYWYTRECFLYKILNKALWTSQPDLLYKFRYFLRQLHRDISVQPKFAYSDRTSLIVYRGQNMSVDQIEKLKKNVGGFVSFNNFLSTSLKRNIALAFLDNSDTGVLFEMFIDTTIKKFPFANIEHLSYQQGEYNESEILFSMGTVFRIVAMDTEKNFHRVHLMLTSDIDKDLDEYTNLTREETRSSCSFLSLLKLMNELKQYNNVDSFAEMFNNDHSFVVEDDILDAIHNSFGINYLARGQFTEALEHFQKSLTICLDTLSADHSTLTITYNNIGLVYSSQSNYETALRYHQLALDCQTNSDTPNISSIITSTNNIASIYHKQEKYNDALIFYKRVLELKKEYLGDNDKSLADTYNIISIVYYEMNDYEQTTSFHQKAVALNEDTSQLDPETAVHCAMTSGGLCVTQGQHKEALEHLKRALQIQQQYYLPNNPALAVTYDLIGDVYYEQNEFEQSLSNHMKALNIQLNSISNDHPTIATSYFSISKDYVGLSFWSDALEYGFKAIEEIKKSAQMGVETLSSYTNHIATIYYQREEYDKALIYYKQALDLCLTYLHDDDASLIAIYYRTGETYYKLERYNEALEFYEKTLKLELKSLPDNAKTIATTYSDISAAYIMLDKFDQALIFSNKAYEQLLKTLPYDHPEVLAKQETLEKIEMMQIMREEHE